VTLRIETEHPGVAGIGTTERLALADPPDTDRPAAPRSPARPTAARLVASILTQGKRRDASQESRPGFTSRLTRTVLHRGDNCRINLADPGVAY